MNLPPMKRNGDRLESDLVLVTLKSGTKVLGRLVHIDGFPRPEWCTCPDGREFKCLSVASWEPLPTEGARWCSKRYFVGRVIVRQEGAARLLASGQVVTLKKCPCDEGKYLLLELVGEEYQPVWWET